MRGVVAAGLFHFGVGNMKKVVISVVVLALAVLALFLLVWPGDVPSNASHRARVAPDNVPPLRRLESSKLASASAVGNRDGETPSTGQPASQELLRLENALHTACRIFVLDIWGMVLVYRCRTIPSSNEAVFRPYS